MCSWLPSRSRALSVPSLPGRLAVALQVEADAERAPRAGQDDGAARAVGGDPVELVVERLAELGGHRVELVGPVEREHADGGGG